MITRQKVNMCYLKEEGVQYEGEYGIQLLHAVSHYEGATIRNNVICKVDFLALLSGVVVSKEHYVEYRANLLGIASRLVNDMNIISDALIDMYKNDKVFRKFLYELYYFQDDDKTFLDRIVEAIGSKIKKSRDCVSRDLTQFGYRFVAEHNGYYYFSVKDNQDTKYLNEDLEGEVVSRAKIWDGLFKRKSRKI